MALLRVFLLSLLSSLCVSVDAQEQCPPGYARLPAIPGQVCFGALAGGFTTSTRAVTTKVITTSVLIPQTVVGTRTSTVTGLPTPGSNTTSTAATAAPTIANEIAWELCPYETDYTMQCAYITVPLDYTITNVVRRQDDSTNTLQLQVVRILSQSATPRNQSIIFNPGGPGDSGIQDLMDSAKEYFASTGSDYHLVSFDPRGTSNTLPFTCSSALKAEDKKKRGLKRGITKRQSAQELTELEEEVQSHYDDSAKCLTEDGTGTNTQYTSFLGTAFVARDILEIVNALNEDGLLRYYGSSYGTTLGETVAAMFPDKIDKMTLDGVDNPLDYYNGYLTSSYTATDAAFSGFFNACAVAPVGNCDLVESNSTSITGTQLQAEFNAFLANMTTVPGPKDPITKDDVISTVFSNLYSVSSWPDLATYISQLYDGEVTSIPGEDEDDDPDTNPTAHSQILHPRQSTNTSTAGATFPSPTKTPYALRAISGSETRFYANAMPDQSSITAWYQDYSAVTQTFLEDSLTSNVMTFATWPRRAKEIYSGSFNGGAGVQTKNPILFVGNTYDPVTPYTSAYVAHGLFPGSGLLKQDSFGHCTAGQPSTCTTLAIKAYWQNGVLPSDGAVCEPDHPPFTNLEEKRSIWKRQMLSPERVALMEVLHDPGRKVRGKNRHLG